MRANEEYVRSVWDNVKSYIEGAEQRGLVLSDQGPWVGVFRLPTDSAAWSAAAEFTRDRLEQVRQLRDQIAFMGTVAAYVQTMSDCSGVHVNRIVARLEAELTRLTAGMKPEKAGSK